MPKSFSDIRLNGVQFINEYKVPVVLYSADDEVFTNNENDKLSIINQKIKIKCESDSPNYVKADEINKDNDNKCIFVIRENKYGDMKKGGWSKYVKDKPKDITIQLTIEDYNKNKNVIQENIPFTSSFKIKNDLHTINLSYRERDYKIYVDNLNDLDIRLSNERLVKIEEINKEKKYIKIKIPYSVDDDFKGVILYLANVLTGQKEEIIINYSNSGSAMGSRSSMNSITDYLFVIVLTCLLLLIGYFLLFSGRKTPNPYNTNNNFIGYGRGYPDINSEDNNMSTFNPNYNNNYSSYNPMNINNFRNMRNNNNNFGNNYGSSNMNTNISYNNINTTGRFNNLMRTTQPSGSMYNKDFRMFNNSNINMNEPY